LTEISRFFTNRGEPPKIHYLRTKEKIELDFLIELPDRG